MSAIKLKHSGGNSVSLAPPTSNPSSDITFKLPQADGSANQHLKTDGSGNLGWVTEATGGKCLQIVQSTSTQAETQAGGQTGSTFNGNYYDIAGTDQAGEGSVFCVKITPEKASSKILFTSSLNVGGGGVWTFKMYRDSTALNIHDTVSSKESGTFNGKGSSAGVGVGFYSPVTITYSYLDTPSYTVGDEITYKVQWGRSHTGNLYLNRSQDDSNVYRFRSASSLIVMEVGA